MNCKQAQRDIALFVGHDLDDPRHRDDLKRHVATCPDCREHYRQMKGTMRLLGQADTPETFCAAGSLWPDLATRIKQRAASPPGDRFNGWAPFVAMTAACFILMLVVHEPDHANGPVGAPTARGPMFTSPVMHSPLFDGGEPMMRPSTPFEVRSAAEDARRLEALRRDTLQDRF